MFSKKSKTREDNHEHEEKQGNEGCHHNFTNMLAQIMGLLADTIVVAAAATTKIYTFVMIFNSQIIKNYLVMF